MNALSKSETLAIRYAENRQALKEIKAQISQLNNDNDYEIDIKKYRKLYYCDDGSDDREPGSYEPFWQGWVNAVTADEHTQEELELAKLLDLKKEKTLEAGMIKRLICAEGKRLNLQPLTATKHD